LPELPEVQTVASELNRKLKNRKIASVEVRAPKIVGIGPAVLSPTRQTLPATVNKFKRLLRGQKFLSVSRRAKLLVFDLSGPWSMLAHLKMTGQFIFEDRALRKKNGRQVPVAKPVVRASNAAAGKAYPCHIPFQ
jgi:formamidopyrimidine-DNA glycosylase